MNMKKRFLFLTVFMLDLFQCKAQTPMTYITFYNDTLQLYKWEGANTMVLSGSQGLDNTTMTKWINAMDGAYNFYYNCTGRYPSCYASRTCFNKKSTIARVYNTCGAGCGLVGTTGIELAHDFFDRFFDSLKINNTYDHTPFYEFGRNYWFYGNKINYGSADIGGGFAVFMQFMAMENMALKGAGYWGGQGTMSFQQLKDSTKNQFNLYMANTTLNWANTLAIGQGIPGSMWTRADLFASFCFKLKELYGDCWLKNVWRYAGLRPDAVITQNAVDNFIIASSQAAGVNLSTLFQSWRWPVSDSAITYLSKYDYTKHASPVSASCAPTSVANTGYDMGVRNVLLEDMQYYSKGNAGDNNQYYIDNTILQSGSCHLYPVTHLHTDTSYSIKVTTGGNLENVRGWIDYNNNGTFESSELVISSNGTVADQTHTGIFTIPVSGTVFNTSLRMRIASDYFGAAVPQPCSNPVYGQTEDFIVYITNSPTCSIISITTQPQAQSKCIGQSVTFSVGINGTANTYQWQKNGININLANSSGYTISSMGITDTGEYKCIITGNCGQVINSISARLTVNAPVNITTHPASQTKLVGQSVTFTVTAPGSGLSYQWKKNGTIIPAAPNSNGYTINTLALADSGLYTVDITNTCGIKTSNAAKLTVIDNTTGIKNSTLNAIQRIYPNPASEEINVYIKSKQTTDIQISILDLKGAELYNKKVTTMKGEWLHSIKVSDFAGGVYFIQLLDKEGITMEKFLVE